MTDAKKNLATAQSDSAAPTDPIPQSGKTAIAHAARGAVVNAAPVTHAGTVTRFSWTDPTLQISTSNTKLRSIQVKATTGTPNGIYFTGSVSARLAVDAATLTNLRTSLAVGMNISLTYDSSIDTNKFTNCTNLTCGAISVPLSIVPIV